MAVSFAPIPMDDGAKEYLSGVLGDALTEVVAQCRSGVSVLLRVSGEARGLMIARLEQYPDGRKELVAVAAKGVGMAAAIQGLKGICRGKGIASIRVHSTRKGYGRFVARMGFQLMEERADGERVYQLKV